MNKPTRRTPLRGIDLLLTALAVTLALVCIPMMLELSGGAGGRAMLLCGLVVPPALGLAFVHLRDGAPRSAPEPIRHDRAA